MSLKKPRPSDVMPFLLEERPRLKHPHDYKDTLLKLNPPHMKDLSEIRSQAELGELAIRAISASRCYGIGEELLEKMDFDKAEDFYFLGLKRASIATHLEAEVAGLMYLGKLYRIMNNYALSFTLLMDIPRYSKDVCNALLISSGMELALLITLMGKSEAAIKNYKNVIRLCEIENAKHDMAAAYANIGIIYKDEGNISLARHNLELASSLFKSIGEDDKYRRIHKLVSSING